MVTGINRADPVQTRKALEVCNALRLTGIPFWPIPITSDAMAEKVNALFAEAMAEMDKAVQEQTQ